MRIKLARKRSGHTMESLAERLGVSTQSVKNWEAGRREPSLTQVKAIASVLSHQVGWFFDEDEEHSEASAEEGQVATGSDRRLLDLLERQQSMVEAQREDTARIITDQTSLMERQRQDISRLTEVLAEQQQQLKSEREFQQRLFVQQMDKLGREFSEIRSEFVALRGEDAAAPAGVNYQQLMSKIENQGQQIQEMRARYDSQRETKEPVRRKSTG